ncbi:MAG: thioesterase family protein [Jatrophihabitantaceae bacterium]
MANAYFQPLDESQAGGRYRADPATGGPWDPALQHGGPPAALLVYAAERLAAEAADRADLLAVRVSVEFVGPVPVAELEIAAAVVRAARSGVLVRARLAAAGRDCLHARVWLVRDADTSAIAQSPPSPPEVTIPADLPGLGASFPYADSIEWRALSGGIDVPGPGVVWARPRLPLLEGRELSGLQRAALVGDSASGISSELDWSAWSFLNVDLDVHLARPLHGEWLCLDARTQLGPHGSALARATLSDVRGPFGCTAQTLVLAPRRPAAT